jgi:hypothetical protein
MDVAARSWALRRPVKIPNRGMARVNVPSEVPDTAMASVARRLASGRSTDVPDVAAD